MFGVIRPPMQKMQNIIEDRFKIFFVSSGTTTSCISPLKSQRFAPSVLFNVIEMV